MLVLLGCDFFWRGGGLQRRDGRRNSSFLVDLEGLRLVLVLIYFGIQFS